MNMKQYRLLPHGVGCNVIGRTSAMILLLFSVWAFASAHVPLSDSAGHPHRPDQSALFFPGFDLSPQLDPVSPTYRTFTLRHIFHHGTQRYPELHRKRAVTHDATSRLILAAEDHYPEHEIPRLKSRSRTLPIERLKDRRPFVIDALVDHARRAGFASVLDASVWTLDQVPTPDVTDKETVLSLAYMTADAYVEDEGENEWEDVGAPFNRSADFGWHSDGLRGHIFADDTNSTIVIGLKGTTPAVFDGDGTTTNDKINDNLFFSCCCAQQGQWTWHKVCDCASGPYACNNTCVTQKLRDEDHYYTAARELYSNVTELYPEAVVWLAGHSLGGAISSLLGMTYGLPVVTFEAVPEALAASRLALPVPPGSYPGAPQTREHTATFHFGNTADPIYIGTCNGAAASCSFAGYALETTCHTGRECVWDVVADKGWRVGIGTHKIRAVIHDVILPYDDVPVCRSTPECRDCELWKMYENNGTEETTTSSSTPTRTRTRTSTCQTPGWWGCLDKTTAPATPTSTCSSLTSSSTTSTCETPGWFWCKDKSTTTTTKTLVITTTVVAGPTSTTSSTHSTSLSTSTTRCQTPGRFWGCWDDRGLAGGAHVRTGPTVSVPPNTALTTTLVVTEVGDL